METKQDNNVRERLGISKLLNNNGQIEGVPKNPRFIRDQKYAKLKQSIIDDPEMLELRECIVYPYGDKFVVLCGNMRLRACKELGYKEIPCKILPTDTSAKKMRAIADKDNLNYGEWDWDIMANEWDKEELEEWGHDFPEMPAEPEESKERKDKSDDIHEAFKLEIDCVTEAEQENMFNELTERGFTCKILTF